MLEPNSDRDIGSDLRICANTPGYWNSPQTELRLNSVKSSKTFYSIKFVPKKADAYLPDSDRSDR